MKQSELSSVLAQVLIAIVVFGAMSVPLVAQPALAAKPQAVTCGDTITQSVNLVADIGPCPVAGIFIGADNITLNCNGHTVKGSRNADGIIMQTALGDFPNGVTIKNCQVTEFNNGFLLRGSHQTVQGNTATNNAVNGFDFSGLSDSNLQGNTATNNGNFGFASEGSQNNKIQGNTATNNEVGFALSRSFGNKLHDNTATNNGEGFSLGSSNHHSLSGNKADNNVGQGFYIGGSDGSNDNNLRSNIATNNGGDGFLIDVGSVSNSLIENKADNNVGFGYNEVASGGVFPVQNTYTNNSCNGNGAGGSNPSGLCKPQS